MVQKPIDVKDNRSNASIEGEFALTSKLSIRGSSMWQRTHGGLRFGSPSGAPNDVNTAERLFQHDRLLRDNNWRVGTGATYSFERLDVFVSYIDYVSGTDTHAGHAFTAGFSIPFELARKSHK